MRLLEIMAAAPSPPTTEWVEALDAYVKADEAYDKAERALGVARQRRLARLEALERAVTRDGPA